MQGTSIFSFSRKPDSFPMQCYLLLVLDINTKHRVCSKKCMESEEAGGQETKRCMSKIVGLHTCRPVEPQPWSWLYARGSYQGSQCLHLRYCGPVVLIIALQTQKEAGGSREGGVAFSRQDSVKGRWSH